MKQPNIILIILDTLRRDTLYSQINATSTLKNLALDGVVYKDAIAPSSWTVPSHASMFTGKYVSEHGIHTKEGDEGLGETVERAFGMGPTLPMRLKELGYRTYSFSGNPLVSIGTGFSKGFDVCETTDLNKQFEVFTKDVDKIAKNTSGSPVTKTMQLIFERRLRDLIVLFKLNNTIRTYLRKLGYPLNKGGFELVSKTAKVQIGSPFFLFLNFIEPHEPYWLPLLNYTHVQLHLNSRALLDLLGAKRFSSGFIEKSRLRYKQSVDILDRQLCGLIGFLKSKSIYDDTLIILTSDHGQSLREKDYWGHRIKLFDELIRVPLIVKYPNSTRFDVKVGYQSLVDMKDFILAFAEGKGKGYQTRESVFSEEYGFGNKEIGSRYSQKMKEQNLLRKAVFKDNAKLVVDGTNGRIEELLIDEVPKEFVAYPNKIRELVNELSIFVGNQNFILPDVSSYSGVDQGPTRRH